MAATPTAPSIDSQILHAYLPATLIRHWAAAPDSPTVWYETLGGALMLCDMSGFTAMSERLAALGKEGAEIMAGVLNAFFDRMLGVAQRWGGVQMKFGGDAMLLFFEGAKAVAHASVCALEMQRAMQEFGNVEAGGERHRLRMRIGIHAGEFFTASAGQPLGSLHYLLIGPSVSRTAAIEGEAEPDQVVLSAEAAARVRATARLLRAGNGCWRLVDLDDAAPPKLAATASSYPMNILRRYLMPPLAAPLATGHTPNFAAEHRSVTAVFINVIGIADLLARSADAALATIDAYLKLVFDGLDTHGGFLGGSDAAETGDKLIVLFGAPVSSERKEASAVRFALDLDQALQSSGLALQHRIGISAGFVFAGEIGSPARREYTVIGDSVNLAARLMTASKPGEIFISAPTADRLEGAFELHRLRPLALKGKSAPVQAYRVDGLRDHEVVGQAPAQKRIVGRRDELAALNALADGPASKWAFVSGEPGIGKSRLVAEFALGLGHQGWRSLSASCQSHRARAVFGAWGEPLRALFGITTNDTPDESWRKLRAEIGRLTPEQTTFAPLVADILSLPYEDAPMLQFLDGKTRRQRLSSTIVAALRATARERPLLLVFDDAHLADVPSLELLADVVAAAPPSLLVCVTSREVIPAQLAHRPPDLVLKLAELSAEDSRQLATAVAELDRHALDAIVKRGQGNPLFLEEMARSGKIDETEMPQTINEVIMARLDRLPYEEKAVLRAASVAGATFDRRHLDKLLVSGFVPEEITATLDRLNVHGFTRDQRDEDATHAFCHMLAQEVIYDTLPYAHRREMHGAIGSFIETERADELQGACGVLLHHFERAGDDPRTTRYAAMTGDRAAAVFANREAIDYYGRALGALQRVPGSVRSDRSALLERIGESLEMEGRHSAATQAFLDSLAEWREGPPARPRIIRSERAAGLPAAREAALCRRIAVSFERRSEYDESLSWLDQAMKALPSTRAGRTAADVFASKSMSLFRKGEYRDAIEWGRRAVSMARRTRDRRSAAYAHNMLANSYIEEGSVRKAIRHLAAAVEIYSALGDVYGLAAANNNLGNCHSALGDIDAAIQHYEISLRENRRAGNDAAIVHNNIAEVLLVQGRIDEAIEHLHAVLVAQENNSDLTAIAGYSQINLSRCHLLQGGLTAADEALQSGIEKLRAVKARGLLVEARLQKAELRIAQGRLNEALEEARGALAEAQEIDARLIQASAERIVGTIEAAFGAYDVALGRLATSAALARKAGAGLEEARAIIAAARVSTAGGRRLARNTQVRLRRAAAIAEGMGARRELAEAMQLLSERSGPPEQPPASGGG